MAKVELKGKQREKVICLFVIVHAAHLAAMVCRTILAFWYIEEDFYCYRILYNVVFMTGTPALLLFSTDSEIFSFHQRKKWMMVSVLTSEGIHLLSIAFRISSRLFLPVIFRIRPGKAFTESMIVLLARIVIELPLVLLSIFSAVKARKVFFEKRNLEFFLKYKLSHRMRPEEGNYPLKIVKDLQTGRYVPITESDRFLHFLCDGSSGTGKTSSAFLPAIRDDLDARIRMSSIQTAKMQEEECDEDCIKDIMLRYPVAGVTVLAPDDSLTDDVCRLCEARHLPYNRIDPTRNPDGSRKSNIIGMNPFYLPKKLGEEEKYQMIVKKAVIFADVMLAITDLKGKSDSYFSGVNRQMIANLAILVMLTIPRMRGRQATPLDLQEKINDFDKLAEPLQELKKFDRESNQFPFIIKYVEKDLLGSGRTKMEDQSRGTRNIINEFLLLPYNREIFCSQKSIDFDRILECGEITVCNYNLAAGDTDATAFGLFFLLSFNNAVLSRPGTEKTRIPHFFYIDELPVLIHPSIEKNFSLFRKFRVAMFVAIQTLDQMEKNDVTKYLKGVILGCAHILVFGRSSLSDMEIFSKFAGVREEADEQESISQTAISSADTKLSYTTRTSVVQRNAIEEIDIRQKDFQEVTLFTTRGGRPLEPIQGKVEFLKDADWQTRDETVVSSPLKIAGDRENGIGSILDIAGEGMEVHNESDHLSLFGLTAKSEHKFPVPGDNRKDRRETESAWDGDSGTGQRIPAGLIISDNCEDERIEL